MPSAVNFHQIVGSFLFILDCLDCGFQWVSSVLLTAIFYVPCTDAVGN